MRFPQSDRVTYEKDTLTEVICQLRFPQILSIATTPPDAFQEAIRDRYPLYRKQGPIGAAPPELAELIQQLPMVSGPETVTHWFEARDQTMGISLGSNFVAVTSKAYPGWPSFRLEVERALDAVEHSYAPAFYERAGLRYVDVLDRDSLGLDQIPWAELMQPALVSLLGADLGIEPGKDQVVTNAVLKLDQPDGASVHLRHGLGGDGGNTYELDADFYIENREIERGQALELLDQLNSEEGHFFRWATGGQLREALGVRLGD